MAVMMTKAANVDIERCADANVDAALIESKKQPPDVDKVANFPAQVPFAVFDLIW